MSSASEQEGNTTNGFKDFGTENGPSQGQNLAWTVLFEPNSLDTGYLCEEHVMDAALVVRFLDIYIYIYIYEYIHIYTHTDTYTHTCVRSMSWMRRW